MANKTDTDRREKENKWIRKIKDGDKAGFEKLYRFYYPKLIKFALRYNSSKPIAEDLVHEVFHNVWKNRQRIKENGKLRAYLFTAVRNQSIKHMNRKKREDYSQMEDMTIFKSKETSPVEQLGGKEFEQAVNEAIDELPKKRREVFLMSREDDLTYREIAEVLEISIKTVETQISRSLRHLRDKLAQFLPEKMIS